MLGPYLQAVGVKSIDAVSGSLADLTEGGLTLVETDSTATKPAGRDSLLWHIKAPVAVASLLVGVRAASSLQEAIAHRHELADGESFVTREGAWVGRGWLKMNRGDDPQVGVIARGDEIKRLLDSTQSTARRARRSRKPLPTLVSSSSGSRKHVCRRKQKPRAGRSSSPVRRRSSARAEPSSTRRANALSVSIVRSRSSPPSSRRS